MDDFNRKILAILQSNNKKNTEEIGREIGLSATAVQRRIKKLKQEGIIEQEVTILNRDKLGGFITIIVEVIIVKGGMSVIDAFKKKVTNHPEVQQCYYLAGSTDFILIITAINMQRYEEITRELFLDDSNILKFTSNVSMQTVKVGLSLPL